MSKLKYFAENVLADLKANIHIHMEQYINIGFEDFVDLSGWSIELASIEVDTDKLKLLDPSNGSKAEIKNSMIVFDSLDGLSPATATEERVWTRLTHFECLDYARKRWPLVDVYKQTPPPSTLNKDQEHYFYQKNAEQIKNNKNLNCRQIEKHYFASGRTGIRDDNAVSRLWWNAYIASRVDPENKEVILQEILRSADIRSNLVERPLLSNRASLLGGIVKMMQRYPDIYDTEVTFREFMKSLNFRGSGVLFETLSNHEIDKLLLKCRDDALARVQ